MLSTLVSTALEAHQMTLAHVVQGGDVLILGNSGMGKTMLAQGLERQCHQVKRRVCVLDSLGDWSLSSDLSSRHILRARAGKITESGYAGSLTTVWDYQEASLASGMIDLESFDDVILDTWKGIRFSRLDDAGPRHIVITQQLDDALEKHNWNAVFVFSLRHEREIAYARRLGGQTLANLGWGLAFLLMPDTRPQPLRIM